MKRWTCGLISMLLCVALLAGCGSKTDGTASDAAKNDTAVSGADGTSMTEPSVMTKGYRVVVKNPAGVAAMQRMKKNILRQKQQVKWRSYCRIWRRSLRKAIQTMTAQER